MSPRSPAGRIPGLAIRIGVGILWAAVVLTLTLVPVPVGDELSSGGVCILCGSYGLADFLRNMLLFLPLGLLAGARIGWARSAVLAVILSGGIEVTQILIPGRYPSLGDIVANTTGGALGAILAGRLGHVGRVIRSPTRAQTAVAIAVSALLVSAPAVLHRPAPPEGVVYYFQWTAELGRQLDPYGGSLLEARVDGTSAAQGPVPGTADWLRPALSDGLEVELRMVVGPEPERLAPIFSIYDELEREVLLIGARGVDLVVRRRDVGSALTLDGADPVWWGAFAGVERGDTVRVAVRQRGADLCAEVDGRSRCDIAVGVGSGWTALMSPVLSRRLRLAMAVAWLSTLGALAGAFTLTASRATAVGVGLALLGGAIGWLAPFLTVYPLPLLALPAGALGGWLASGLVRRRAPR